VEEVSAADEDASDASPLGNLQKGTIDLTGITIGQCIYTLLTFIILLGYVK
jgi:hypothetical protein